MVFRFALLLASFALAACVDGSEKTAFPPQMVGRQSCGIAAAVHKSPRVFGPTRACAVPSDAEIEEACTLRDDVLNAYPPEDYQELWPPPGYPSYKVARSTCTFDDAEHTSVTCTYDLLRPSPDDLYRSGPGPRSKRATSRLTYKVTDLSDDVAHDYFVAGWEAETMCTAN